MYIFTGCEGRYAFRGKIPIKYPCLKVSSKEYVNLGNSQWRFDLSWKVGVGVPVNNFLISLEADLEITDLLESDLSFRDNRVGVGVTYYF